MGQPGEDYEIWLENFKRRQYLPLVDDLEAEVVIVGGGITGILSAYFLAKAGRSVILLEQARFGEWTTDCTTAFLTQLIDTSYENLVWMLGAEQAKQISDSHGKAIDLIEKIIQEEKIDCDFKRSVNRLIARTEGEARQLKREVKVLRYLGLPAKYHRRNNLNFPVTGYLELANQATYHPMKFLTALAARAEALGAKIYEQTEVTKIKEVRNGKMVSTKNGPQVRALEIIIATYEPFGQPLNLYFKKALYRSYVYEFAARTGAIPDGLYEDLYRPYHYFKVDNLTDRCRIIFGGEDHREDLKISRAKNYLALEQHARKILAGVDLTVRRHWGGQILESIDGLAYIGRDRRSDFFYAFGFSGNGLTYSVIAASLFTEQISGQTGPMSCYQELYRVNRWPSWRSLLIKGRDYAIIVFGGAVRNFFARKK